VSSASAKRLRRPRRTVLSATRTAASGATVRIALTRATLDAARRRAIRVLTVTVTVRVTNRAGRSLTRSTLVRVSV
jgi:hypothetical protein